jgi:multidrug transporter EmrE-like cation transporter
MGLRVFIAILSSVALNAFAQVFLRKTMLAVEPIATGADMPARLIFSVLFQPAFVAGMFCYALSIIVWLFVLSKIEVSAAYPFLSIGYVIAAAVGFFYLGESVTMARLAGIALICAGLVFIAHSA